MKWTLALGLAALFLGWTRDVDPAHPPQQQVPQKTATSAELERRDLPVTSDDLRILLRADELLKDESVWNRKDDRECDDDEASGQPMRVADEISFSSRGAGEASPSPPG